MYVLLRVPFVVNINTAVIERTDICRNDSKMSNI